MLTLIVPVLINFLADPNIQLPQSSYKKVLHEICLQKLMKIGLQYRDVCRNNNNSSIHECIYRYMYVYSCNGRK